MPLGEKIRHTFTPGDAAKSVATKRARAASNAPRRFWERVSLGDNCWEWNGHLNNMGYGVFTWGTNTVYAHRYAYEALKAKIPDRFDVDHLCRNTRCVNPDHLEAVTHGENLRRGYAARRLASAR